MSEGISYREILNRHDNLKLKGAKFKALQKAKHQPLLSGKNQKEQMSHAEENVNYQKKIGRAWND